MRRAILAILAALALWAPAALAAQCGPARGQVGQFDYYLLSLSWSPGYCATPAGQRNRLECGPGAAHGFVVHGLWPQFTSGRWPQCCQAVAPVTPSAIVDKVAKVMIGPGLMEHEWEKHGSCVTAEQDGYFGAIDTAVGAVGLAPGIAATGLDRISVSALKRAWPVPAAAIAVRCRGKRLSEVHICLDRELAPTICPQAERSSDTCPGTVSLH